MDFDDLPFEQQGSQEWFCSKLRAPLLPAPLAYRTRLVRGDGDDFISVEIVRPRPTRLRPNRVKVVVAQHVRVTPETDWRDAISTTVLHVWDAWDLERSKVIARQGENPYIGTFHKAGDS